MHLLLPAPSTYKNKPPLVVYPHGGPHSTFNTSYQNIFSFYCTQGYAVLLVNFRGSLGYGESNVRNLPGKCGDQDIKDVQLAAAEVLKLNVVDEKRLAISGGSHGGFISAHLIGQYPNYYKACILRNPVTNIAAMYSVTDIPEWCVIESAVCPLEDTIPAGQTIEDTWHIPLTAKHMEVMFANSPMNYVNQVVTPTLLVIGLDDKRVPIHQARQFYYALKQKGVTARLLCYPNNGHAIVGVEHDADCVVNMVLWLNRYV